MKVETRLTEGRSRGGGSGGVKEERQDKVADECLNLFYPKKEHEKITGVI